MLKTQKLGASVPILDFAYSLVVSLAPSFQIRKTWCQTWCQLILVIPKHQVFGLKKFGAKLCVPKAPSFWSQRHFSKPNETLWFVWHQVLEFEKLGAKLSDT